MTAEVDAMPNFEGTFNFEGEIIKDWNHARDPKESKRFFITKLAGKLGRTKQSVRRYFSGQKDNFKIKLIKE